MKLSLLTLVATLTVSSLAVTTSSVDQGNSTTSLTCNTTTTTTTSTSSTSCSTSSHSTATTTDSQKSSTSTSTTSASTTTTTKKHNKASTTITLLPDFTSHGSSSISISRSTTASGTPIAIQHKHKPKTKHNPKPKPKPKPVGCDPDGVLEVQVDSQPKELSNPICGSFTSLSFEFGNFGTYFGTRNNINAYSVQLLKNLGLRSGVPAVVRLGGNSQDRAIFEPNPKNNNQSDTYTTDMFYTMKSISNITGTKWVFGLNFGKAPRNNTILAAVAGARILGKHLEAFTIGNEPEGYAKEGYRKAPYTPDKYLVEWEAFTEKLKKTMAAEKVGPVKFRAGETCCGWNVNELIGSGLLNYSSDPNKIEAVSDHFYPQSDCPGSSSPLLSNLLSHNFTVTTLSNRLADNVEKTLAAGYLYALGETNSVACGGRDNVSDVFGTTLWTIDYALSAAVRNVSMLNFHSSSTAPYKFWATNSDNTKDNQVRPVYYALLFLSEAIGGKHSSIVDIPTGDDSLVVYAIWSKPDKKGLRVLERVVVLNLAQPSHPAHRPKNTHHRRYSSDDVILASSFSSPTLHSRSRKVLIELPIPPPSSGLISNTTLSSNSTSNSTESDTPSISSNINITVTAGGTTANTSKCARPTQLGFKLMKAPNVFERDYITWGGSTLESSKTGKLPVSVPFDSLDSHDPDNESLHVASACECGKFLISLGPYEAALLIVKP